MLDCFAKTLKHDGMGAFYNGFLPNVSPRPLSPSPRLRTLFLGVETFACRIINTMIMSPHKRPTNPASKRGFPRRQRQLPASSSCSF